ncbi:toxin-activating lysine-acyltransferase [Pseudomonas sp. BRG-100]|uniref:toxin-activating lysine-acyltransferase n=1 Tax=Pseudomonas sp. BRG-100 TaxID=1524267 RepID=UPI0006AD059B|nr:toxin-activating lysine-acyltransferase [Pseudomonas sp. BRG-100]
MNKQYRLFTACKKTSIEDQAKTLGFSFWIAMQSPKYLLFRLIDFRGWLMSAIQHKQIIIFFDVFDNPIGYVTWANLSYDVELRLLKDPNFSLHESEWDEGDKTWIIDCCFPFGDAVFAMKEIRRVFKSQSINTVHWARREDDYSIRKVVRRKI